MMHSISTSQAFVWIIVFTQLGTTVSYSAHSHRSDEQFYFARVISRTDTKVQRDAVRGLIERLLPTLKENFEVEIKQRTREQHSLSTDSVILLTQHRKLYITATSGVAGAYGFHHFLKYFCKAHISWNGDQLHIATPLPTIQTPLHIQSPHRFRYYQNVCTASYSFVWWNWTRWEREIDWMALNGINLPLALTGQEAIWRKVYLNIGLKEEEVDHYFGGPAFLAWQRMGNIQGWGGPLPLLWMKQQLQLQKKLLSRMRAFGMIPVLPGFAGHVPGGIQRLFPSSKVTKFKPWSHFSKPYCCTLFLDPGDDLFKKIANSFIQYQIEEYNGTDHVYSVDIFNEMDPVSSNPTYLSNASAMVWQSLRDSDRDALWIMQGWLFHFSPSFWRQGQIKAFLSGVPVGKLIILDLYAEKIPVWKLTHSFYGHAFIWCLLNNFGGNYGLIGNIEAVMKGPLNAKAAVGQAMVGTGITPEAIGRNYILFDLMSEMGWRSEPVNLYIWTQNYTVRRYGNKNNYATSCWWSLVQSVYKCAQKTIKRNHGLIVQKPAIDIVIKEWYKASELRQAWHNLMHAGRNIQLTHTYRYDLVDIGRQVLQDLFGKVYKSIIRGYIAGSFAKVFKNGRLLLIISADLDRLLATNVNFLLGNWLESAKSKGTTLAEKRMFEFNARNQITLWGPTGNILDYASKDWSGLVSSYYLPRWKLFIDFLLKSIGRGVPFNTTKFNADVLAQGLNWTHSKQLFSINATGVTLDVCKQLWEKYKPLFWRR